MPSILAMGSRSPSSGGGLTQLLHEDPNYRPAGIVTAQRGSAIARLVADRTERASGKSTENHILAGKAEKDSASGEDGTTGETRGSTHLADKVTPMSARSAAEMQPGWTMTPTSSMRLRWKVV